MMNGSQTNRAATMASGRQMNSGATANNGQINYGQSTGSNMNRQMSPTPAVPPQARQYAPGYQQPR